MSSLAAAAFKRYQPVAKSAIGSISLEELDKITMHLHKAKRISKDVSTLILESSLQRLQEEPNIVHWSKVANRKNPRTFVFANIHLTYEKLHHLISPTILQYPSPDNQYVFLGCKFDKSTDSLRGLLSLLTMQMLYPQSICILRSRVFEQIHEVSNGAYSTQFASLEKSLPISLVVDNQVFITNGGVSNLTSEMTLHDLQNLSRMEASHSSIFNELICGVPTYRTRKNEKSERLFNANHLEGFLMKNNLKYLIRNSTDASPPLKVLMKAKCVSINGTPLTAAETKRAQDISVVNTKLGQSMSCLALLRGRDKPLVGYKLLNL